MPQTGHHVPQSLKHSHQVNCPRLPVSASSKLQGRKRGGACSTAKVILRARFISPVHPEWSNRNNPQDWRIRMEGQSWQVVFRQQQRQGSPRKSRLAGIVSTGQLPFVQAVNAAHWCVLLMLLLLVLLPDVRNQHCAQNSRLPAFLRTACWCTTSAKENLRQIIRRPVRTPSPVSHRHRMTCGKHRPGR